jgi:hypothetical protein
MPGMVFVYGSIIPGPIYIRPGRKVVGEGEIRWSTTTGRAKTEQQERSEKSAGKTDGTKKAGPLKETLPRSNSGKVRVRGVSFSGAAGPEGQVP